MVISFDSWIIMSKFLNICTNLKIRRRMRNYLYGICKNKIKRKGKYTMIQAITDRRSIRKYQERFVPKSMIEEIIRAGMLAPSAKNRQPWKIVVVTGGAKEGMLAVLSEGLERERKEPFLAESAGYLDGAEYNS